MVVHAMGSTYAKNFGDFKFVTAVDLKKLLLLLLPLPIFSGRFSAITAVQHLLLCRYHRCPTPSPVPLSPLLTSRDSKSLAMETTTSSARSATNGL
ncbi:hypothetical protein FF2_040564 [Malus domestica]